jgi:imidazolonepropionase-like amidohydrolase
MRRIIQVLSLVLLLPVSAQAKTIAIKAGLLIADARKSPIPNAVLVIEDGKITSVGSTVPAGAEVIDLSDFTVMPGLMDGHTHLWTSDSPTRPRIVSEGRGLTRAKSATPRIA